MLDAIFTVRQQRFIKMWAKSFAVGLLIVFGVLAFLAALLYGIVMFGKAYGEEAVFALIIVGVIMLFVGGFTHSYAKIQLLKAEREEQKTLDALGKDYDKPLSDLDAKINSILGRKYKNSYKPYNHV